MPLFYLKSCEGGQEGEEPRPVKWSQLPSAYQVAFVAMFGFTLHLLNNSSYYLFEPGWDLDDEAKPEGYLNCTGEWKIWKPFFSPPGLDSAKYVQSMRTMLMRAASLSSIKNNKALDPSLDDGFLAISVAKFGGAATVGVLRAMLANPRMTERIRLNALLAASECRDSPEPARAVMDSIESSIIYDETLPDDHRKSAFSAAWINSARYIYRKDVMDQLRRIRLDLDVNYLDQRPMDRVARDGHLVTMRALMAMPELR